MAIYANSRWYEFLKEAKDSKSNSKKTHESENWIWVDGYKGFTKQYVNGKETLCGRNSFPYNPIGEITCLPENEIKKLEPGVWGLHFCDNLRNACGYHNIICEHSYDRHIVYNTVFAKIKAEVEECDYLQRKKFQKSMFVARKIIIEEIIPYDEIYDIFMSLHSQIDMNGEIIHSKEDYLAIKKAFDECGKNTNNTYEKILKALQIEYMKKLVANLVSYGYSETFANIIVNKYSYNDAIAYAEEGLSKDMRAYLLIKGK